MAGSTIARAGVRVGTAWWLRTQASSRRQGRITPPTRCQRSPRAVTRLAASDLAAHRGFRVGGKNSGGCGPVRIADSFVTVVDPGGGGHQDGLQAYDGPAFTIRNTTIDMREAPDGTAAFFAPANQGNTSAVVDRLLVMGAGIPFRHTIPGRVTGLKIVDKAWYWAPMDVDCSLLSHWDAKIVTIDPHYQVTSTVRNRPC